MIERASRDEQTIIMLATECLRWRYRALKAEQGHEPYPSDAGDSFDNPACEEDRESLKDILIHSGAELRKPEHTAALVRFGAKRRLGTL